MVNKTGTTRVSEKIVFDKFWLDQGRHGMTHFQGCLKTLRKTAPDDFQKTHQALQSHSISKTIHITHYVIEELLLVACQLGWKALDTLPPDGQHGSLI